jgi:hypothetical protein
LNLVEELIDIEMKLTHCCVRGAALKWDHHTLLKMFWYFMNLKVLFIIIDTQPDLQSADNDIKMQQQWKFKSTLKGTFFWNNNCGRFDLRNSKNVSDKALYRLIKRSTKSLMKGLLRTTFTALRFGLSVIRR